MLDRQTYQKTSDQTVDRADKAHDHPLIHKSLHDLPVGRSHRLEDGDILILLQYNHDQSADDIEARHQDNKQKEHTQYDPLQSQTGKEIMIELSPVHDPKLI